MGRANKPGVPPSALRKRGKVIPGKGPTAKVRTRSSPAHPIILHGMSQREQALELRKRGLSYSEIGRELSITRQTAHEHVWGAIREARERITASTEDLREMEMARLDLIWRGLVPKIMRGDPQAANAGTRIVASVRAMYGLDAPTKQEHSGPSGGPIVVDSMASVLARGQAHIAALRAQETAPAPVLPSGELAKKEEG